MTVTNVSFAPLQRIYQQHQDKLILAIVVLLSLYLIAFLAEVTWRLFDNSQALKVHNSTSNTASPVNNPSSKLDLSALKRLNLFGNPVQVQAAPAEEQEVTSAPETKLNLTLTGVVASSTPELGAAIIERNSAQNTYGVGDKIEGTNATLDKIYTDRVIIKNRLTRETLMLDGVDFDEANRNANTNQTARTSNNSSSTTSPTVGPQRINPTDKIQNVRSALAQSPSSFADFISIKPHSPDGQLVGYRVSPGKQPEFFKEVGLRSGDIITQINGLVLSDIQQSLEAITVLKEAQSLSMEIIRSGEPMSLDIEMPSSEAI